ncbi:MAG: lipid-A-disaccharide synthase, partial [Bacteroidales bacterium]|nr:lipid-A-disaccharide synthase [Bacteroidales bacterium]
MTYYMIAGEASGDLHASKLISSLRSEDPQARFRLWGGDLMLEAAGDAGTLISHYREGAVMGFVEVVRKGLTLLKRLSRCKEDLLANRPD